MISAESLIEQFGTMVSAMATQKDMQKDYVVRVRGKKVNIIYESSDEELCRNFLAHVVKTTILEDITISIKGPVKEDMPINMVFCNTSITGSNTMWSDSSAGSGSVTYTSDI